ncbi:MAG: hypothetical protein PHD81_04720 [Candidatus Nanoarchaeia archaeon]|nr:hypothetical protein [Candidatus Nanoarchaeia archaeon]MDD5588380.1 hypothetical protein [Candidatus Nanoarchaeia archaeon]
MKNIFIGIIILFLISISFVSAGLYSTGKVYSSCNPTIKLVNQDPNPAVPNEYVTLTFETSSMVGCNGYSVMLNPNYPFSLDPNENPIQTITGSLYSKENYKAIWTIPYKVKVAGDALDGEYKIKLFYYPKTSLAPEYFTIGDEFNVTIEDVQTEFDAVLQESTGSEVSIAIANVGKYTANSVIVRVPEQDSFSVSGTNGQMVGNLESGDYTLVAFTIQKKGGPVVENSKTMKVNESANFKSFSNKLKFDIYYTDNIGERRIVMMEIPLSMTNSSMLGMTGNFAAGRQAKSSGISWYKWIIILVILIIVYFLYRKYPEKTKKTLRDIFIKVKRIFKKEKTIIHNAGPTPGWIVNTQIKDKKKQS